MFITFKTRFYVFLKNTAINTLYFLEYYQVFFF